MVCQLFLRLDEERMALYFMTETRTRHGGMLLKNPRVAGTIAHQTKTIALIRGLQFSGEAVILEDENEHLARSRYYQQFPAARLMPAPVWQLSLNQIKMTDNKLGFAKKFAGSEPLRRNNGDIIIMTTEKLDIYH